MQLHLNESSNVWRIGKVKTADKEKDGAHTHTQVGLNLLVPCWAAMAHWINRVDTEQWREGTMPDATKAFFSFPPLLFPLSLSLFRLQEDDACRTCMCTLC